MKHLIKIESVEHGVLGVRHAGLDQQYCEAGEQVILNWQPDAKWGLQEVHYTDGEGNVTPIDLTPTKVDGKDVVVFTMPDDSITIGGTFKKFVVQDWTTNDKGQDGKAIGIDENGNLVPVELFDGSVAGSQGDVLQVGSDGKPSATEKVNINSNGDINTQGSVYSEGAIASEDYISAEGDIHVSGQYGIIFHTQDGNYSLTIDNGNVRVDPYNQ